MTHTFFINASSGTFERYQDLVEMEIEKRTILTPDLLDGGKNAYPIKEWYDFEGEKRNYEHCADKIAEIIDMDKNVGDGFNLIVYIDLTEFTEYDRISERKQGEKFYCREALRRFLRAFVYHTLLAELEKRCCEPKDTLLILDTGCGTFEYEEDETRTHETQCNFLGLDSAFLERYKSEGVCAENFEKLFMQDKTEQSFWQGIRDIYLESLKLLFSSYLPEISDRLLVRELMKTERFDCLKKVKTILFEENRFAIQRTMREFARVKLVLYIYLLQCVNRGTFLVNAPNLSGDDSVIGFHEIDIEATKKLLHEKYRMYDEEYRKFSSDGTCAEMKANFEASLSNLPYERYGLNQYGMRVQKPFPAILENLKIPAEMRSYVQDYVSREEMNEQEEEEPKKKKKIKYSRIGSAQELLEKASAVKKNHEEFPEILKTSVKTLTSGYASGSDAKLARRKESEEEAARYLMNQKDAGLPIDCANIQDFAETAYQTAKEEYLKGNRVRAVSATVIDDQYEWLKRRAKDIEKSIASLKISALIVSLLLFCAYLPFFIIQKSLIFVNLLTVGAALITAAIPFVFLLIVFIYLIRKQEDEYAIVYHTFLEKAEESVLRNKRSWNEYVELFENEIPSLRYLYEYKEDVDGAFRYYRIEQGKCHHHRNLLARRRETVGNILEDLSEIPEAPKKGTSSKKLSVDYRTAFSSGKNAEFYSILTAQDIEAITTSKGDCQ